MIPNTQVSIVPTIALTNWKTFCNIIEKDNTYVGINFPWTAAQIQKAPKTFTTEIHNCCSACLDDGNSIMSHISSRNPANQDFLTIEKTIMNKVDKTKQPFFGFLTGGELLYQESLKLCKNFQKMFEQKNIPYVMLIGQKEASSGTAIAYNSKIKTFFCTNPYINTKIEKNPKDLKKILNEAFEQVNIPKKVNLIKYIDK